MFIKARDKAKKNSLVKKCGMSIHAVLSDNRGVAMIYAIIVGTVVMVFCLSLLLVTYTLFAETNRQNTQLQCKLMAQTFAQQLEEDMKTNVATSELVKYMGDSIKDDKWRPSNSDDAVVGETRYTDLIIDCDSEVAGYTYNIVFTYTVDLSDDEGDAEAGAPADVPAEGSMNCTVVAKITCVRGLKTERDAISYTVDKEFDITVPLS